MVSTQLVKNLAALRDIVPAWDMLARHSLEPNVFYESWALLPALEQFASEDVGILLVWQDASHSRLLGLFPLVVEHHYYKCPACHWSNWLHAHCPLGTPLIHQDFAAQAMAGLFAWLYHESGATVFTLRKVGADGAFYHQLQQIVVQWGGLLDASSVWERALLDTNLPAEAYLRTHQRRKKFKDFARLRRRLAEVGRLQFHALLPGETTNLEQWLRDFLRLEQSGWKGRQQSALSCKQNNRLFAEALIRNAAQYGQLLMLKMTLDDEVIAMKLSLTGAAQGVFTHKIAYNEAYAQYSPGVLLEVENLYRMCDNPHLGWVDSCTTPGHPLFDHLWAERRKMASLHISTRHLLSKPLIHTMRMAKTVYKALHQWH